MTGHADFLKREKLSTARARFDALDRMYAEMARIVAAKPLRYWLRLFAECDIPASEVKDLDAVFSDPHLTSVGFFERRTHPSEGDYLQMRLPVRFHGAPGAAVRAAPRLGEHSEEIDEWLREEHEPHQC